MDVLINLIKCFHNVYIYQNIMLYSNKIQILYLLIKHLKSCFKAEYGDVCL